MFFPALEIFGYRQGKRPVLADSRSAIFQIGRTVLTAAQPLVYLEPTGMCLVERLFPRLLVTLGLDSLEVFFFAFGVGPATKPARAFLFRAKPWLDCFNWPGLSANLKACI